MAIEMFRSIVVAEPHGLGAMPGIQPNQCNSEPSFLERRGEPRCQDAFPGSINSADGYQERSLLAQSLGCLRNSLDKVAESRRLQGRSPCSFHGLVRCRCAVLCYGRGLPLVFRAIRYKAELAVIKSTEPSSPHAQFEVATPSLR